MCWSWRMSPRSLRGPGLWEFWRWWYAHDCHGELFKSTRVIDSSLSSLHPQFCQCLIFQQVDHCKKHSATNYRRLSWLTGQGWHSSCDCLNVALHSKTVVMVLISDSSPFTLVPVTTTHFKKCPIAAVHWVLELMPPVYFLSGACWQNVKDFWRKPTGHGKLLGKKKEVGFKLQQTWKNSKPRALCPSASKNTTIGPNLSKTSAHDNTYPTH